MNAVKSCLVVLAAAVALTSCSADPTSDSAGKNLKIIASPGAVVVTTGTADSTAIVIVSALDPLGGAVNAQFTISNVTGGAFTAAVNTGFLPVYAGTRPQSTTQIIVNGHVPGDGSFTVTGPGGTLVIPVRVIPDPASIAVTLANKTPGLGVPDTVTLPVGLRFTSGTTVAVDTAGAFAAVVQGMSADSSQVYFLPGFGSHGHLTLTGMANVSTPTLTFSSVTTDTIGVAGATATASTTNAAANAPVSITLPAGFKFKPTSSASASGLGPILLGVSADSNTMTVLPQPGTTAAVTVSNVLYTPVNGVVLSLPTSAAITVGAVTDLGGDDPAGVVPIINLPGVGHYGTWDLGTFAVEDESPDGGGAGSGINSQVYRLVLTGTHTVVSQVNWTVGNDVDVMLLANGTSTNQAIFGGGSGATAGKPETNTSSALAAATYMLDVIDWSAGYPPSQAVSAVGSTVKVAITVQ